MDLFWWLYLCSQLPSILFNQHCPLELNEMMEMLTVLGCPKRPRVWLLSPWNVVPVTEKLNFLILTLNSHTCLLAYYTGQCSSRLTFTMKDITVHLVDQARSLSILPKFLIWGTVESQLLNCLRLKMFENWGLTVLLFLFLTTFFSLWLT